MVCEAVCKNAIMFVDKQNYNVLAGLAKETWLQQMCFFFFF